MTQLNESIKKLMQKLHDDKAAGDRIFGADSFEDAYQMAIAIQDGFSKDEFAEALNTMMEKAQSSEKSAELDFDSLENVAGGTVGEAIDDSIDWVGDTVSSGWKATKKFYTKWYHWAYD